jgi:predicted transcriptional regulator
MSMVVARLGVRLDPERRRRLDEIVAARGVSASEIIRRMIDRAYEDVQKEARARAARGIAELAIEDGPDPDVLTARLESTHDAGDLR